LKLEDSLRNNGRKEHVEEGVERDQDKLGTGIWEKDNENIKVQYLLQITNFPRALFYIRIVNSLGICVHLCAFPKFLKFRYWDYLDVCLY